MLPPERGGGCTEGSHASPQRAPGGAEVNSEESPESQHNLRFTGADGETSVVSAGVGAASLTPDGGDCAAGGGGVGGAGRGPDPERHAGAGGRELCTVTVSGASWPWAPGAATCPARSRRGGRANAEPGASWPRPPLGQADLQPSVFLEEGRRPLQDRPPPRRPLRSLQQQTGPTETRPTPFLCLSLDSECFFCREGRTCPLPLVARWTGRCVCSVASLVAVLVQGLPHVRVSTF